MTNESNAAPKPRFRRRFTRRVFVIIIATLVLSGLMTGGLGFWLTYRTVQREKIARSTDLLLYLAANAEHGVVARDDTFVQPAFARLLRSKTISGVAIYGSDGAILFSRETRQTHSLPTRIDATKDLPMGATYILKARSTQRLMVAPIYSSIYDPEAITFGVQENSTATYRLRGYAVMRLVTRLEAGEIKDALMTGIILFLAVVLMGTLLAFAAATRITNPIQRIITGIEKFTGGDLTARIPVANHDEVGQIAFSFNRLAASLAQRMEELESWSKGLEQEVSKRTLEIKSSRKFLHSLISPLSGATSSWADIAQEIIEGAQAVYCALYHLKEDGNYSLLATHSRHQFKGTIQPRSITSEETELFAPENGPKFNVTWFPLTMKDHLEGQLVLGYETPSCSRGFVDQVLSALTITIANIHSFEKLSEL
ncbi:HAMP domain-containing protein, partial [Myxococcota bacterium]|nr:HAMP domain-containing protein [Myxococcota bacterium]